MRDKKVESAYWALRLVFGVVPIAAGLDKFANLLADWQTYLSPLAVRVLPFSPTTFMYGAGIIEIAVGVGVLAGYARLFGWVASGWLLAIALNLVASGSHLDVAARDVALAAAAFALASLAPLHEATTARRAVAAAPGHADA